MIKMSRGLILWIILCAYALIATPLAYAEARRQVIAWAFTQPEAQQYQQSELAKALLEK